MDEKIVEIARGIREHYQKDVVETINLLVSQENVTIDSSPQEFKFYIYVNETDLQGKSVEIERMREGIEKIVTTWIGKSESIINNVFASTENYLLGLFVGLQTNLGLEEGEIEKNCLNLTKRVHAKVYSDFKRFISTTQEMEEGISLKIAELRAINKEMNSYLTKLKLYNELWGE